MKIKRFCLLISIMSFSLMFTGCGEPLYAMTEEEEAIITKQFPNSMKIRPSASPMPELEQASWMRIIHRMKRRRKRLLK